jgi:hypothetical protein
MESQDDVEVSRSMNDSRKRIAVTDDTDRLSPIDLRMAELEAMVEAGIRAGAELERLKAATESGFGVGDEVALNGTVIGYGEDGCLYVEVNGGGPPNGEKMQVISVWPDNISAKKNAHELDAGAGEVIYGEDLAGEADILTEAAALDYRGGFVASQDVIETMRNCLEELVVLPEPDGRWDSVKRVGTNGWIDVSRLNKDRILQIKKDGALQLAAALITAARDKDGE